jgi:hypothetical protein
MDTDYEFDTMVERNVPNEENAATNARLSQRINLRIGRREDSRPSEEG